MVDSNLCGDQLRDAALDAVEDSAPDDWKELAYAAVLRCAETFEYFTSDDVWEALDAVPPEPRALGAIMAAARRAGAIVPTDRVTKSYRPTCHSRPVRLWRSLLKD